MGADRDSQPFGQLLSEPAEKDRTHPVRPDDATEAHLFASVLHAGRIRPAPRPWTGALSPRPRIIGPARDRELASRTNGRSTPERRRSRPASRSERLSISSRRQAEEGLRRAKEALEYDLRLAARVQQSLLPPPEMHLSGLRVARAFHPCTDLAGDGMGVFPLPCGSVGLYLLDVSGHGVGAALLSFTLNHLLSPSREGSLLVEETSPILLPAVGPPVPVPGRGLPIGMIEHASYQDETVVLQPGDRLYLYTDGVLEAPDASDEEFGSARLMAELERVRDRPLGEGLTLVADAVRDWSDGGLRDDVSLLAIERVDARPGVGVARGSASAP